MGSTFTFWEAPVPSEDSLSLLPAEVANWFRYQFGEPTPIQRLAWSALTADVNLLISAPTGTGKTLAAMVPILCDVLKGGLYSTLSESPLRVLVVAPLKALVNDAQRNLVKHLNDLAEMFSPETTLPSVGSRTGDTSAQERKHQREHPPEILFTTPESLAVMLSQPQSISWFANLRWILIDEVHALAGNKRGADLALSLERLTALSRAECVRRVGLSATATPLETVAQWLVGKDRDCTIVRSPQSSPPEIRIDPLPEGTRFLSALVDRIAQEFPHYRASLTFTNTRALSERLSWQLRRRLPEFADRIAVHHSALSAARRRDVEQRFKKGELVAVVCSTSLELGIDIGTVDLAVLVHPPGDVIRLLQRIGRAGHDPDGIRRGLILTANASELLEAAVTTASGQSGQCEPMIPSKGPLDVLCQQLLGMCCAAPSTSDDLYSLVCRSTPYADLSRKDFDDCLAYLLGLDSQGASWLPARLREDGDCLRVVDAKTARILRRNLGTILADENVPVLLRRAEQTVIDDDDPFATETPLTPIGEIEEAFADRLQPGDRFLLDGRCLEFRTRENLAAVVEEVIGRPRTPTWTGEGWPLSGQLAQRLYLLRQRASEALREGEAALGTLLRSDYGLTDDAIHQLSGYFQQQERLSEIPDATTLLVECVSHDRGLSLYLHTPLNRPGNDALARVAVARLGRDLGIASKSVVADLGFALHLRKILPDVAETLRRVFQRENFAEELDQSLTKSETIRSRFARVAMTGLMVLRNPEGKRRKVGGATWAGRELFEQVRAHDADFLLIRQALREVRAELCDLDAALAYIEQLPRISLRCRWLSRPSPFAATWSQEETGPIDDAAPTAAEALMRLHAELTAQPTTEGSHESAG